MTRPLKTRFNAQRNYTTALQSIWNFSHMVVDPSFALSKDIDFFEVALRDGKVAQGVQQRLNNVAARGWVIDPGGDEEADKELARLVTCMLKNIRNFRDARKRIAQGSFRATSFELILGGRHPRSLGGGPLMQWWLPTRLKHIDNRRFMRRAFRRKDDETGKVVIHSKLLISVIAQGNDEGNSGVPGFNIVKHPELLLTAIWDNEEGRLGFGRGLNEQLYFLTWVKGLLWKEGLQGVERWAQGIVTQKFDNSKVSPDEAAKRRDDELDELARMKSRGVFVFQEGEDITVLTGGAEGNDIVRGFIDYIDDVIIGLTTGAVLASSGGDNTGSFARDKVGNEIQETVIQFDREKVDENISDDLIGLSLKMNRANLSVLGLQDAARPVFRTMSEPIRDPQTFMGVTQQALMAGIPLKKDETYEGLQRARPADDDDVFTKDDLAMFPVVDEDMTPVEEEGLDGDR